MAASVCGTAAAGAHGDVHDRIVALTQQIQRDTRNASLIFQRGELHRLHQEWPEALADFKAAEALNAQMIGAVLCRAKVQYAMGQFEAAKASIDQFLLRQPNYPEALVVRAQSFARLSQPLAAAQDYLRAIRYSPEPMPDYYLEAARAFAVAKETGQALRILDEGLTKLGNLAALQDSAIDLLVKDSRIDEALARLDRQIAAASRKEAGLARRGEMLVRAGRVEEARAAYSQALAAMAALPPARRNNKLASGLEQRVKDALAKLECPVAAVRQN